ncbi:SUMF1/EgtB/PvdO family nonheme iron enzyme [Kitasatospora nipponensis]|uniref:SUMF1/EgtB/PvdO family nonheme iron enzyme n=1 Tax=Kitasatospora nipponensis TaxID=258049 RepID=UPI0031DE44D8
MPSSFLLLGCRAGAGRPSGSIRCRSVPNRPSEWIAYNQTLLRRHPVRPRPRARPGSPGRPSARSPGRRRPETSPVSRYHCGVSPYGVFDLRGNTWEWCASETEPGSYELKAGAFTRPFSRATPAVSRMALT